MKPEQIALRKLRKLLRGYNVVHVGDVGIQKALEQFLLGYGIKPLKPTKGQIETIAVLNCLPTFADRQGE